MRVIFTGQMGMEKKRVIQHLGDCMLQNLGYQDNQSANQLLQCHRVEDYVAHDKLKERLWVEYRDVEQLIWQWGDGFKEFQSSIVSNPPKNIFLAMHAVIYKYNRFISPVDWNLLRDFKPDLFITFIDDVIDIWWHITHGPNNLATSEDNKLSEILSWRSAEIMVTNSIARNLNQSSPCPHYVVAVKQPVQTLLKLILNPETLRVYSAYPITEAKKALKNHKLDAHIIEEINSFRAELHKRYITFDPITIDEFELKEMLDSWKNGRPTDNISFDRKKNRWSAKSGISNLPLLSDAIDYPDVIEGINPNDVEEIEKHMSFQIQWRDFSYLDQVHCMAAYRPNFNGGSFGVQRELAYAGQKSIPAYQFWPVDDGNVLRPFKDTGIILTKYDKFLDLLENQQKNYMTDTRNFAHHVRFITE